MLFLIYEHGKQKAQAEYFWSADLLFGSDLKGCVYN